MQILTLYFKPKLPVKTMKMDLVEVTEPLGSLSQDDHIERGLFCFHYYLFNRPVECVWLSAAC